ncbi:cysteine desulfurase-like protein [Streptomyces antimycoticus]|uniref:cysteine desulfurase-like protein n=1 Tax=Streptomyces antimycoticus TaxID=68175 RepID=UPI000A39E313|nr:cysteine desulfurase-like protein [Streptomyces antimycoticus]
MTFNVTDLRSHFPSLATGVAHFDAPGGTQTPRAVGEAIARTLTGPLSNLGGEGIRSEVNAEDAIAAFRAAYSDLLGVPEDGIVYGRSATQLNYDFSRTLAKKWQPGDEVVVSRLDHDANVRPWVQAAEAVGAEVRWIDFDPATAEVTWESVEAAIGPRTRLVAITAASNLLGTKPPVRAIADAAHAVGALVHVDAVHYAAHNLVDVPALGADLLVCSPYKFLGPHCAVLTASPQLLETLTPDKLVPSSDAVPERFEFGTLPFEILAGATAAVDFLAQIAPGDALSRRERLRASFHALEEHEMRLRKRLEEGLAGFGDAVVVHSRAADRTPTMFLTLRGRRTWDAYEFLATKDVLAPAGSFYAYEAYHRLNLDDPDGLRLGLAPYVDDDDVSRFLAGLAAFLAS